MSEPFEHTISIKRSFNNMSEPFEHTTCVITHPQLQGVFYCEDVPHGLTQDLNLATKYMGAASRMRGLENMMGRYPKIKDGQIMFFYLTDM